MTDEERARDLIWRITGPSGVCRPSEPNVAAVTAFIRQVRAEALESAATNIDEVYETYPRVGYEEYDIDYGRLQGFEIAADAIRKMAAAERAGKETGR